MPAPGPTSLLDQVDDADEPIGLIERRAVFTSHAGFRVAHVFVQNQAGSLLLQQVGDSRERSPLRWGSSVAAYVYAGETYASAARRRLYEELGLRSSIAKLGGRRMADQGATKFIELFLTTAESAEIREPLHIEAVRFWSLEEINEGLEAQPDVFTETFPYVYRLFGTVKQR